MSGNFTDQIFGAFTDPDVLTGEKAADDAKKSKKRAKNAAEQKKRADDLTNAFGRTLLNNPLGNSGSLLQGRPGGAASSSTVLG